MMSMSPNDTAGPFDIDILRKIEHDIKSEWEGDEPGINFFLLLFALFGFVVWIVFISFFFSRLLGLILAYWLRRFLKWSGVPDIAALSIGAFSISVLSGKIMFRDFLLVTEDFTLRINDGWIILSYWKYLPKNCTVQECMNVSRLHILMNGLKIHLFNRMSVYQNIARQAGMSHMFGGNGVGKDTTGQAGAKTKSNTEMLEMQLDAWWDNIWRLFGAIRFEVTSARLIVGNNILPTACMVTFENLRSRIFLTDASNKSDDRYMFRLKATAENLKMTLIKATDFVGSDIAGIKQEDPPRTMGNGFVVLQSAMLQFYYHQDLLGLVKEERQSANLKVPVWETIWRLDKNTIFSYGPWADKQRALIYAFFFPSDYGCAPVTEMPQRGQRRVLINHDVRVSLLHDASVDFWFMRYEELNAIHSRIKQGSSFEFYIPFVITDKGYTSDVRGSLLCLESTTSLPFREFLSCETLRFNVTMHCPRSYNHHQVWDICIELHQFSMYFLWDHKRFVMDIINEWNIDNVSDLCKFIPCTYNVNISAVDQFEIVLLLNDKNWVDTVSTRSPENIQAAIVGAQLYMNFALEFCEFDTTNVNTFELSMKAEKNVAVRVHLPPQSPLHTVFATLLKTSRTHTTMRPSGVRVNIAKINATNHNAPRNNHQQQHLNKKPDASCSDWFEVLRTELITLKCEYEYYALFKALSSDLPVPYVQRWISTAPSTPWQLEPDNLFVEVNIDASEILVSGLLLQLILNFKDNYFSDYDQTSDVATKPLHAANTSFLNLETPSDVYHYRTMNTFFKLRMVEIRGHCLTHNNIGVSNNEEHCPIASIHELVVELKKVHLEFHVQVVTSPIVIEFSTLPAIEGMLAESRRFLNIDGVQFRGQSLCSDFDVPWSAEALEYGWMVEVIVDDITGLLHAKDIVKVVQFFESFLLLALFADEEMEMPERSNKCQHFQNMRHCSRSTRRMMDTRRNARRSRNNCESVEALKYRSIRVSVDALNVSLADELSSVPTNYVTHLNAERVRFAFCNAHAGVFCDNFLLNVGTVKLSQFIRVSNAADVSSQWARCGLIQTACFNADCSVPNSPAISHLADERRQFLHRHDKSHQRLYFLWNKAATNSPKTCACYGGAQFFGEQDLNGTLFFGKSAAERMTRSSSHPRIGFCVQPAYQQSILDMDCSALCNSLSQKDSVVSLENLMTRDAAIAARLNESARKVSDASFHSASSSKIFGAERHFAGDNIDEYDKFLEIFHRTDAATFLPVSNGIRGLCLVKHDERHMSESQDLHERVLDNKSTNGNERDNNANGNVLDVRIDFGERLTLFTSIMSLEIVERLVTQFAEVIHHQHPATLAERIYRDCAAHHHEQPLTVDISDVAPGLLSSAVLHATIALPTLDVCLLKCRRVPNASQRDALGDVNAVALAQIPASYISVKPPTLTSTGHGGGAQHLDAIVDWRLSNVFTEIIHIVDANEYDNVFNKTPTAVTTNWKRVVLDAPQLRDLNAKTILDVGMPTLIVSGALAKTITRRSAEAKICAGNRLSINVPLFNVIVVFGKSIEDPPIKVSSNNTGSFGRKLRERSLFESLAPFLSAWSRAALKCASCVSHAADMMAKYQDLVFMKLLADALDWHDDTITNYPDRISCMQDVKLHYRNMRSCASCRLICNMLQYATRNNDEISANYWQRVIENEVIFRHQGDRKTAIIALLSHWQTVICIEIQLADNKLAHKYKYHAPLKSYAAPYTDVNAYELARNNVTAQNGATAEKNSVSTSDSQRVERSLSSDRDAATLNAPTRFRPTHRRGPSTATQMTATANENEPQDLYHWILKAHKEYKDRRTQSGGSDKISESNDTEINSMELLLSVFFWTIYEKLELERSVVDALPSANVHVDVGLSIREIHVSVVEKKFLISQHNEILVALSSHNLLTLENFDLNGKISIESKLDEYQLRPAWGNVYVDYACKVQDVRLVVSLASVFFINDATLLVRFLVNDLDSFAQRLRAARQISSRVNSPPRVVGVSAAEGDYESWPGGVLNKLYDYERSPYKRREFLQVYLTGNWSLKMIVFESMITDLFISITLLKLQFQQRHTRLSSSGQPSGTADVASTTETSGGSLKKTSRLLDDSANSQECKDLVRLLSKNVENSTLSVHQPSLLSTTLPLTLDRLNVALRRANLIVAEHIVVNQRNSDTRQILNCTLRESMLVYERLVEHFRPTVPIDFVSPANSAIINKLNLSLGELEADLPMHAQSIHEMVLRHGPHLNEQLHRIVGQPQLVASENFVKMTGPVEIGAMTMATTLSAGDTSALSSPSSDEYFNALAAPSTPTVTPQRQSDGPSADTTATSSFGGEDTVGPSITTVSLPSRDQLGIAPKDKRQPAEIEFDLRLAGIELNAKLLSSLKAKYKLQSASGKGRSGRVAEFSAEISNHHLFFQVTARDDGTTTPTTSAPIDTFTLQLPRISANGAYRSETESSTPTATSHTEPPMSSRFDGWNKTEMTYRAGGYYDITIFMGSIIHTFSTDLLNQILFAEQSFRSELAFLVERLSSERPKTPSGASFLNVKPILFNLEIKGEGVPWLQITATTPTSIAVRFTIDSPNAVFTNRLIRDPVVREDDSIVDAFDHRLFGQAKIQLNVKLGQLYKTALYEETQDELEEYANFMTQISIQNEDSMATNAMHTFAILLNRPFLLIKSNAIDKAILLWLNYRNTYNYWRKEREKLLRSHRVFDAKGAALQKPAESQTRVSGSAATSTNFAADMNINLSLSIRNGLYVCMPLYSPEPSDNLAALMLSLQKSDVTVCVRKELVCNATFNAFKVSFIDNFDEQTLSEPWLYESNDDASTHSNYFFFPHGSYKFCTSAVSPTVDHRNAKWILSVKSHMQGMVIDFDYIGKLTNLLVQTLTSSFAFDDEIMDDDYAPSDSSYAFTNPPVSGILTSVLDERSDRDLTVNAERVSCDGRRNSEAPRRLSQIDSNKASSNIHAARENSIDALQLLADDDWTRDFLGQENRTRLLERKMHEQSVLVTDLINLGASEFAIEKERRKLRILELARFKNFRRSMWDKLRQKMDRQQSASHTDGFDGNYDATTMPINPALTSRKLLIGPKTHKHQASRSLTQPIAKNESVWHSIVETSPADALTQRQLSQQPTDSVDMNIDVQINIECGQCILRANQPQQSAAGSSTLTSSATPGQRFLLTKKPSARDLKSKTAASAGQPAITKLSIPSLNANMFYTSNDPMTTPPAYVSRLFSREKPSSVSFSECQASTTDGVTDKNKCFYMTLELASMPIETLITPSLADFLEQVVEPLPESLFEPSAKTSSTGANTPNDGASSVPIVAIDASSLPLDVLFHMSVQSSAIRFEGQQQRSSAADCLLTLPGLTLMASTRKNDDPDRAYLAGIYVSATLSSFSLNVYSPHQQSSAHDAFSLTLDRFSISASRSTSPFHNDDDRNRVELVILSNVGSANLNYDMRRLSELLTFPRPWYRKQLVRRLFFGEHSLAATTTAGTTTGTAAPTTAGAPTMHDASFSSDSRRSTPKFQMRDNTATKQYNASSSDLRSSPLKEKEWAASVVFSMQWKELNVNAQMSNTMGNTVWIARNGVFRGHLQLDSQKRRDIAVSFKLRASELNAQGGAISGEASIARLLITARHSKHNDSAPENQATLQFNSVETRIEWMSRSIFIGRFVKPRILISDEWKSRRDERTAEVIEALCLINISGSWQDLQMIITKNTVTDMIKIGQKLIFFFKDQLKSSRIAWDQEFFDCADAHSSASSEDGASARPSFHRASGTSALNGQASISSPTRHASFRSSTSSTSSHSSSLVDSDADSDACAATTTHWQRILDLLSDIQMRQKFLALPTADNGVTFVGGNIELRAERISLACMNGEINASSWALFHMKEVGALFDGRASYAFLDASDSSADIGIRICHRFTFALGEGREKLQLFSSGHIPAERCKSQNTCNAVVCRVQHRGFFMRHNASIDFLLEAMIGDVLKQLEPGETASADAADDGKKLPNNAAPHFAHSVLRLFLFPALEAVFETTQHRELHETTHRRQRQQERQRLGSDKAKDGQQHASAEVNATISTVKSTFVCKFHDAVCVQTDFNAQVGFLPELLKSYMISQPEILNETTPRHNVIPTSASTVKLGGPSSSKHDAAHLQQSGSSTSFLNSTNTARVTQKDPRNYVCAQWIVDPKIMFIDRFKWNPPVIDEILKKLQIFDHRQTIPKVLQRGLLDRCDLLIAVIERVLVNQCQHK